MSEGFDLEEAIRQEADIEKVRTMCLNWIETARLHACNEGYYQGLLDQCATHLGVAAWTQDDGNVIPMTESPLWAKVPELVAAMAGLSEYRLSCLKGWSNMVEKGYLLPPESETP